MGRFIRSWPSCNPRLSLSAYLTLRDHLSLPVPPHLSVIISPSIPGVWSDVTGRDGGAGLSQTASRVSAPGAARGWARLVRPVGRRNSLGSLVARSIRQWDTRGRPERTSRDQPRRPAGTAGRKGHRDASAGARWRCSVDRLTELTSEAVLVLGECGLGF